MVQGTCCPKESTASSRFQHLVLCRSLRTKKGHLAPGSGSSHRPLEASSQTAELLAEGARTPGPTPWAPGWEGDLGLGSHTRLHVALFMEIGKCPFPGPAGL